MSQEMVRPRRSRAAARSVVGESARPRHRGDQEGRRPGAPRPAGSAGAGPSPVPPADLHVLLLEDLLVLLQKQDEKLLLKCHSKTAAGASDGKQTFSPVLKLNAVLVRSVATGAGRGRAHPPRPGPWLLAVVSSRPGAVWGRPGVPQDFPGHLRPSPVPAYLSRRRGTSWAGRGAGGDQAKTDGLVQPRVGQGQGERALGAEGSRAGPLRQDPAAACPRLVSSSGTWGDPRPAPGDQRDMGARTPNLRHHTRWPSLLGERGVMRDRGRDRRGFPNGLCPFHEEVLRGSDDPGPSRAACVVPRVRAARGPRPRRESSCPAPRPHPASSFLTQTSGPSSSSARPSWAHPRSTSWWH